MAEIDRIKSMLDRGKSFRSKGENEKAKNFYDKARAEIGDERSESHYKLLSQWAYEVGFLAGIEANYELAIASYTQSSEFASQADDLLRCFIGEMHSILNKYFSCSIGAVQTHSELLELNKRVEELTGVPSADQQLHENSRFNANAHTMELAFDSEDEDRAEWLEEIVKHSVFVRFSLGESVSLDLFRFQVDARKHICSGEYDASAEVFSKILGFGDYEGYDDDSPVSWSGIQEFAHSHAERMARDYRDLGRALRCSSHKNRKALAALARQKGLALHEGRGNLVFQHDIRSDMKAQD